MWVLFNKKVSRHHIYGVDVPDFELTCQIAKNNLRPSLDFEASDHVKKMMQRYVGTGNFLCSVCGVDF